MTNPAPARGVAITEPGVYDLPVEAYHADPVPGGSLSSTGARKLLSPSCPAKFRHWRDHGQETTRTFDLGHAAHRIILGAGADIVSVDAEDWRTKDAQEQSDQAHAEGKIPLLAAKYEQVLEMAAAVLAHPIASALFKPGTGRPEQTLIWRDQGIVRRALIDWLPNVGDWRMVIPDYKTCRSADPEKLQRAIADYGYHQQGEWYLAGARALRLATDPAFVFVFQEKDPPYVVTVAQPDPVAMRIAAYLNRRAVTVYAECMATDTWPGYSDDVELIGLPTYIENRYAEELYA